MGIILFTGFYHTGLEIVSGIKGRNPPADDANSGIKGFPEISANSGISGLVEDIKITAWSGLRGIQGKYSDNNSAIKGLGFVGANSGICGTGILETRSAILGGRSGVRLGDRIWANFTSTNMDNVSSVSSQQNIFTALRILYDYDYGRKTFRRAIQFEARGGIAQYGRIEKEIQAYWLSSSRVAARLGERLLKYFARPKWEVSFNVSLDYSDIPTGEWVTIDHPLVPISGQVLITNAQLDLSAGEVSFTVEKSVDSPVVVELTKLSEAFAPISVEGLTVTYRDGIATFTILNDLGEPLGGAAAMLDGVITRTTDSKGQVQFTTTRGNHRLLVEATGFAPLEFSIVV